MDVNRKTSVGFTADYDAANTLSRTIRGRYTLLTKSHNTPKIHDSAHNSLGDLYLGAWFQVLTFVTVAGGVPFSADRSPAFDSIIHSCGM
jgi:hypothetical protein